MRFVKPDSPLVAIPGSESHVIATNKGVYWVCIKCEYNRNTFKDVVCARCDGLGFKQPGYVRRLA